MWFQFDILLHIVIKSTGNYYNQGRRISERTFACLCINASLKKDSLVGSL